MSIQFDPYSGMNGTPYDEKRTEKSNMTIVYPAPVTSTKDIATPLSGRKKP
jgi:hypothetical protein